MGDSVTVNIFKELKERFIKPWKVLSFKLYFFIVIILFGGMGVINTLYNCINKNNWDGFPSNLMTYSLAILVPASITILLHFFPLAKNKVSLVILCITVLSASFLMAFTDSLFLAIICMLLAWVFWIIANSDNAYLDDNAYNDNINSGLSQHGTSW